MRNRKETLTEKAILAALRHHFPEPKIELDHKNAFELIIAAILAAQATDKKVNDVTPGLFKRYPTPKDLADADLEDLKKIVQPLGFFNFKSKMIKECSRDLVELYAGRVPDTIEELTRLQGVGRKTASVIIVSIFHKPAIVVDTHVIRLARERWCLSRQKTADKIESDLARFFSRENWIYVSQALVLFGRHVCTAKSPNCPECFLKPACPYDKKTQ
jgi:endonuclease-3